MGIDFLTCLSLANHQPVHKTSNGSSQPFRPANEIQHQRVPWSIRKRRFWANRFAQLFSQDFDLLLEVFDHALLVAVDPIGQADEEELKVAHCRSIRFRPPTGQFFCVCARQTPG
jgi:hypothetical protein